MIQDNGIIGEVDPAYLSFTFDWWPNNTDQQGILFPSLNICIESLTIRLPYRLGRCWHFKYRLGQS